MKIPYLTLFVVGSIWLLTQLTLHGWENDTDLRLALAQKNAEAAFNTVTMDTQLLKDEKVVDARLHLLPNLLDQRVNELKLIGRIFSQYHVTEHERNVQGNGVVKFSLTGSQNATLQTLYALNTLPIPIRVTSAQLQAGTRGVDVTVDGHAIGAPVSTTPIATRKPAMPNAAPGQPPTQGSGAHG